MNAADKIKTRFAPSPTGHLHVGSARTALFCWLLARKTGGTFLLRIEDTDRARHVEGAVEQILEDLRWLGIDADEGFGVNDGVGGDAGPYEQSGRLDIYNEHIDKLLADGKAYYAFDTADELTAMREAAQAEKRSFLYPRPATLPTADDVAAAEAEGRPVVVRMMVPGEDVTVRDEVFGDVTIPADQQDDFIIRKADGWPTYHLANVVDDALMGVNFILRGQEFLGQTWRHKVLRQAMGFDEPRYAHLPLIMDMKGRKLSKRDGDVDIFSFRKAGYLPEAMTSFIALLGWSPGTEQEIFSMDELCQLFSIDRLGKANAKFDRDKLAAFNTSVAASADSDHLLRAFMDFLALNDTPFPQDEAVAAELLRTCAGYRTFPDIVAKAGILFEDDEAIEYDPKAVKKVLAKGEDAGWAVLGELRPLLAECEWTVEAIDAFIADFCQQRELGMGKVAQPIRVAVTGRTVSPGLADTLMFLGKEKTLARIDRCLASR